MFNEKSENAFFLCIYYIQKKQTNRLQTKDSACKMTELVELLKFDPSDACTKR